MKIGIVSYAARSGITHSESTERSNTKLTRTTGEKKCIEDSNIFYDLDSPSSYDSAYVPHQALFTSSSRKPRREVGMLRSTREDMSILGNVSDCQHAQRDRDEVHNYSRNFGDIIGDSETTRN